MNQLIDNRLNTLRALTAIYVVLHHVFRQSNHIGLFFAFGQEAVMVFFLLSGRVISESELKSRKKTKNFYKKRILRIYPPLILTILLTILMHRLKLIHSPWNLSELMATLFSVADISSLKPGVIADPFLGNSPIWSLSYEMFFYLIFPVIRFLYASLKSFSTFIVPIISLLGLSTYFLIPNHLSLVSAYLITWWVGYNSNTKNEDLKIKNSILFVTLTIMLFMLFITCAFTKNISLGVYPGLFLRHFAVVFILFVLMRNVTIKLYFSKLLRLAGQFAYIAKYSYGLYIVHYPVLVLWEPTGIVDFFYHTLICIVFAIFVESKKLNPIYHLLRFLNTTRR